MIYPRFNVLRSSLEINLLPSVSSFASDDNEDKDDDFAAYHWHHLSKIFPTKRFLVPRTSRAVLIRKKCYSSGNQGFHFVCYSKKVTKGDELMTLIWEWP